MTGLTGRTGAHRVRVRPANFPTCNYNTMVSKSVTVQPRTEAVCLGTRLVIVGLTLCQLPPVVSLFLLHSHSADPPPPLQPPRPLHHLVPGLVDQEEYIQSVLNDIYVYYHCSTNCCMQYQVVQSIIEPHLPVKITCLQMLYRVAHQICRICLGLISWARVTYVNCSFIPRLFVLDFVLQISDFSPVRQNTEWKAQPWLCQLYCKSTLNSCITCCCTHLYLTHLCLLLHPPCANDTTFDQLLMCRALVNQPLLEWKLARHHLCLGGSSLDFALTTRVFPLMALRRELLSWELCWEQYHLQILWFVFDQVLLLSFTG